MKDFNRIYFILPAISFCFIFTFSIQSCSKPDASNSSKPGIASLKCNEAKVNSPAISGTLYTGVYTIPYTGGNGATYGFGAEIKSTGITGLTATLQPAVLANGDGIISYAIKGTPLLSGTAYFPISFGDKACTLELNVEATSLAKNCIQQPSSGGVAACLASLFKGTLSPGQLAGLQYPLTGDNARRWSDLPAGIGLRNGLELGSLNSLQLSLALELIRAATNQKPNEGFDEFQQIRQADDFLFKVAGGSYSSEKYRVAFIGIPGQAAKWMLQVGGHNYAQNISYADAIVRSITPLFQGIEPASWTSGNNTYAPLAQEVQTAAQLLASLSPAQLQKAIVSTSMSDILLGPGKDGQFPNYNQGLKASELDNILREKLMSVIAAWLNDFDDVTKAFFLSTYSLQLEETYISISGNANAQPGNAASFLKTPGDYIRISGPQLWIELMCKTGTVISSGIKYSSVFRDRFNDYDGL